MDRDDPAERFAFDEESPRPAAPVPAQRERYAADGSCAHPELDPFDRCRLCGADASDLNGD